MGHFWLEFDNQGHQQRFDFDQASVSIGREEASDFHLDHPTVSRQHALIVENYGNYQLVVLSRNGLTAVDGQVVSGTVDLRPGMTIQVGEVQLGFRAAIGSDVGEVATEAVSLAQVNAMGPTAALRPVEESTEPSRDAWNSGPSPQQGFAPNPGGSGFGQNPVPQGFGQQGPNGTNGSPNGGFNGAAAGPGPVPAPAPPAPTQKGGDEFKIKSWEEIAAEAATGAHDAVSGPTDFERIQKAQAKATKKGGTDPKLLAVAVAAVVGIVALLLYEPEPPPAPITPTAPARCEGLRICYPEEAEPKCANPSDCEAKAQQAYNVADELTQKKDANITNRYEAYKQLDKAGRYLAIAGLSKPPESMKDFDKRIKKYEADLESIAKDHRIRHHQLQQRNMNYEMATNVRSWQAYFPDTYNEWYKEAIEAERRMKDKGTWPKRFDKK